MKPYSLIAMACFGAFAFVQVGAAQSEIPFDSDVNFFHGLPDNIYMGEASGVAVNSKGEFAIFSRGNSTGNAFVAAAAQLLEFGPDGNFIREIGHNLYAWSFAHAVRFDKDDNLWAIDKGSNMIVKFNPAGRPIMIFGRKQEAADDGTGPLKRVRPPRPPSDGQFRQPTDVTWDPQGDIFISDGYINSRVAKFDKNGDWVKSFGEPTPPEARDNPAPGQLNTPHSIASDREGNIYVADRGNRRIQVFDSNGNFERQIHIDVPVPPGIHPWMGPMPNQQAIERQEGAPWAICITPGPGTQYLYSADSYPGRIYKLTLDGKVLGYLGKTGHGPGEFGWVHELACPTENTIYAAELLNWRVQKLTLHPTQSETSGGGGR